MRYYAWVDGPQFAIAETGVARVLTEADAKGRVVREIGFDVDGMITYRFPDAAERRRGFERGLFDLAPVSLTESDDLTQDQFEKYWHSGK